MIATLQYKDVYEAVWQEYQISFNEEIVQAELKELPSSKLILQKIPLVFILPLHRFFLPGLRVSKLTWTHILSISFYPSLINRIIQKSLMIYLMLMPLQRITL